MAEDRDELATTGSSPAPPEKPPSPERRRDIEREDADSPSAIPIIPPAQGDGS